MISTSTQAAEKSTGTELVFVAGKPKGIHVYRLNTESGELTATGLAGEMGHASFLAVHPNHRVLYAVGEGGGKKSTVNAFSIEAGTGKLTLLNQMPAGGADPCHLSVDYAGKHVLVANYGGGSISAFSLAAEGALEKMTSVVQHKGSSVDLSRQAGPHAHCIISDPGDHHVLACDLGLDKVLIYRLDARTGELSANDPPFAALTPGAGPRHIAVNPTGHWAYVVNELNSTLTVFNYTAKSGALEEIQSLSTIPSAGKERNYPAEVVVAPSGKFVYGSNRGHDSIAVFAVDKKSGQVSLVEYCPTQGKNPRHFEIDPTGKFLLAANVDSGNVVVFRIDQKTGKLTPTGHAVEIKSPMCVKCLPGE